MEFNVDWTKLDGEPFQNGRFQASYPDAAFYTDWTVGDKNLDRDCQDAKSNFKEEAIDLASVYNVTDNEGGEIYILKFKRAMSRMVDHKLFAEDPIKAITNSGITLAAAIEDLINRFPLEKDFKIWFELETNTEYFVPENRNGYEICYPADWSEDLAEQMPFLMLYVETKNDPSSMDFSNPKHAYVYFKKNAAPYRTRKRILVEGLKMSLRLLQYELFAHLVSKDNFMILENTEATAEHKISITYNLRHFFLLILRFTFNREYFKGTSLKKSPTVLNDGLMPDLFSSVIDGFFMSVFKTTKSSHQKWREQLPEEMFMLMSRIEDDPKILYGNNFMNLIKELEYPYEEAKIQSFEQLRLLGSGTFGDVFLARHKASNRLYAIKVIKNYKQRFETTQKLLETLMLLSQFHHSNVVKHHDAWTSNSHFNWISQNTEDDTDVCDEYDEENSPYYSAYEYSEEMPSSPGEITNDGRWNPRHRYTFIVIQACKQSLFSKMKESPLSESESVRYMKQFVEGVQYINGLGFMHRDVKPQNTLISMEGNLMIADLDTVKRMTAEEKQDEILAQTLVRTPAYVSPEMASQIYNEKTDYYSIGISFAKMLYPEESKNMEAFKEKLHSEQLPQNLHPQYAFLLRWLTEEDSTDRIGFLSFPILTSLLQRHKYKNFVAKYEDCYSTIIEHKHTGVVLKCVRVANRKSTIRQVVRRYSRRPEDYASVLSRDRKRLRTIHDNMAEYQRDPNVCLRIEHATEFEAKTSGFVGQKNKKILDLCDNRLILTESSSKYVYVCYGFDEYETGFGKAKNPEDWFRFILRAYFETFVRWGSYSFSTIHRGHFKNNCFIIEPSLIDANSGDISATGVTLMWPPEKLKIDSSSQMTEAGSIFSFGLFLMWNLLHYMNTSEDEILRAVKSLQRGDKPSLLRSLPPHFSQLIIWFCASDCEKRPLLQNISPTLKGLEDSFPFNLPYDRLDCINVTENGKTERLLNKHYWKKNNWGVCISQKKNYKFIYTISNREGVSEKVLSRLQLCGNFVIMPLPFVRMMNSDISNRSMLDMNEDGKIVLVPLSPNAVDWCLYEAGDGMTSIHVHEQKIEYEPSIIYNSFVSSLDFLSKMHKRGQFHGNINYDTFLLCRDELISPILDCLSDPAIIEAETKLFNPTAYISDCSSPEQISTGVGSPESDVFSLGVTLFAFLCYINNNTKVNLDMFQNGQVEFPDEIPQEYRDLISKMTRIIPTERIDCEEALKILTTTCKKYADEVPARGRKLLLDKTKKTERQLPVSK